MAKLECLSNKSEIWCGRGIVLMFGPFGGGAPPGKISNNNPHVLQSEAFCGVFMKETL